MVTVAAPFADFVSFAWDASLAHAVESASTAARYLCQIQLNNIAQNMPFGTSDMPRVLLFLNRSLGKHSPNLVLAAVAAQSRHQIRWMGCAGHEGSGGGPRGPGDTQCTAYRVRLIHHRSQLPHKQQSSDVRVSPDFLIVALSDN